MNNTKRFKESLEWALKAEPLAQSVNKAATEALLKFLGMLYSNLRDPRGVIDTHNRLLADSKEFWDEPDVLYCQAFAFFRLGLYFKAIHWFNLAEQACQRTGKEPEMISKHECIIRKALCHSWCA